MKLTRKELANLATDPYWSTQTRKGEKCVSCGFPAQHAKNGNFCPYCGYPENIGGLESLCIR